MLRAKGVITGFKTAAVSAFLKAEELRNANMLVQQERALAYLEAGHRQKDECTPSVQKGMSGVFPDHSPEH